MKQLLLAAAVALGVATPAAAAPPAYTVPEATRLAALTCSGDLTTGTPVLLIHGTGVLPHENWSWGYERDLKARGHGVCIVTLPNRGFDDIQRSVEYTATAIEQVEQRSGQKIAIVGHSQGGLQPLFALRLWPQLAEQVDDVVGISGVYDNGSESIGSCHETGCSPERLVGGEARPSVAISNSTPLGSRK
jgi:triacylglycerol lipase